MLGYLIYTAVAGATLIFAIFRGVYLVFEAVAIVGSWCVPLHEACHKLVARVLGVGVEDRGMVETDDGLRYRLDYDDDATPRAVFIINLAPLLLAIPALAGYWLAWNWPHPVSWLLMVPSFLFGMMSLPSIDDFLAIFWTNSFSQPVSSVLSSLLATPPSLAMAPSLYIEDFSFLYWILWSFLLALLPSPYRSSLFLLAVEVARSLHSLLALL